MGVDSVGLPAGGVALVFPSPLRTTLDGVYDGVYGSTRVYWRYLWGGLLGVGVLRSNVHGSSYRGHLRLFHGGDFGVVQRGFAVPTERIFCFIFGLFHYVGRAVASACVVASSLAPDLATCSVGLSEFFSFRSVCSLVTI